MASNIEVDFVVPPMRIGEPAWAVAQFYPLQGNWSEDDYFQLEPDHFVELSNGCIEVLPMPNPLHQLIVMWLADQLKAWNKAAQWGTVYLAPVPLKLNEGEIREPDVLIAPKHSATRDSKNLASAKFVVEVVSQGAESRRRDYVVKREIYAQARIPEYWIVDPEERLVLVLTLAGDEYVSHGQFAANEVATSPTLIGFSVNCADLWAVENDL